MKILALDIDGTLIDTENNKEKIKKSLKNLASYALAKEYIIILCTGRSKAEIYNDCYLINILSPSYLITNCGMEIFEKKHNNFDVSEDYIKYINSFDERELLECVDVIIQIIPNIKIQGKNHNFKYKKSYYLEDKEIKVLKENLKDINEKFKKIDIIVTFRSEGFHYLDIQHSKITKFGALDFIAKINRVSNDSIYYFGDNGNDMPCVLNIPQSFLFSTYKNKIKWFYDLNKPNIFLTDKIGSESIIKRLIMQNE
jgi:HAD superfamily hydrolase (TIGR01484 family)